MKKIYTILLLLITSVLFFSCEDAATGDDEKPGVEKSFGVIYISVPYKEDVSHINIFRRIKDEEDSVCNIGQIIPTKKLKEFSWIFKDNLIVDETEYEYLARYCYDGVYKISSWSYPASTKSNFTTDPTVTVSSGATFSYDEEDGILTLNGTFDDSECQSENVFSTDGTLDRSTIYNLCLAVSNGSDAATFKISRTYQLPDTLDGSAISLPSKINTAYFNKKLTVIGVLYQKITYMADGEDLDESDTELTESQKKEKAEYYTVNWSIPVSVPIMQKNEENVEEEVETIIVPLRTTPDDDFDYSDTKVNNTRSANTQINTNVNTNDFFVSDFTPLTR